MQQWLRARTNRNPHTNYPSLIEKYLISYRLTQFMGSFEVDLSQEIKKLNVPGFSVAAATRDRLFFVDGFGLADIKQKIPATPETVYMWFSVTKIVTATAIMQLVDQGKLGLDDKVNEYIPDFPAAKGFDSPRVRHLLNHSSGLGNPIPISWVHPATEQGPDPNLFLSQLLTEHGKLKSGPGERARYSNIGYLALGMIIAISSRKPYKEYVLGKILKPMGMNQTNFYYTPDMLESAATGYQKRFSPMSLLLPFMRIPKGVLGRKVGDYIAFNRFYLDGSAFGGLIGPVTDAARLLRIHVNSGRLDGVQMLSEESVAAMQQISSRGRELDVGYGWFKTHSSPEPYLQQIGGGAGFYSIMRIYPEESLGIVVMGNSTNYNIERIIRIVRESR